MDKRGVGLSDRVLDSPTLGQSAKDIQVVLDAVKSKEVVIISTCEGAPAACLATTLYPERIQGLILLNAFVKGSRTPDHPWALPLHLYDQIFENVRQEWGGPYAIEFFAPGADAQFRQWWAKFLRLAASPGVALESIKVMRHIDMTDLLPKVTVPTLVMHSRQNPMVRVESGRYTADHIPNARYVEIPGRSHLWWWDADPYLNEIDNFLDHLYDGI
jgi:pimeloyl-ACP methyl ester carboxylesterase